MNWNTVNQSILDRFPDTEAIILFGSFGRGQERPESDLDVAVMLPPPSDRTADEPLRQLQRHLEDRLSRDVDLINLRQANTVFQLEVLTEGKVIYCREGFDVLLFQTQVLGAYQKLNEERAEILRQIEETGRVF